ncbi:hypothetical protein O3P69_002760 [Scylla paramamosain]|uniref:Uncharacterized protein n=1 Tax=Scylla paramamosain TaxID=85552 RepID=A0AAW0UM66_SCYPA
MHKNRRSDQKDEKTDRGESSAPIHDDKTPQNEAHCPRQSPERLVPVNAADQRLRIVFTRIVNRRNSEHW